MTDGSGVTKDQQIQAFTHFIANRSGQPRDVPSLDLTGVTRMDIKGHRFLVKEGMSSMTSEDLEQILLFFRAQELIGQTPWERGREMAKKILGGISVK
jgi:hypothetical protein